MASSVKALNTAEASSVTHGSRPNEAMHLAAVAGS